VAKGQSKPDGEIVRYRIKVKGVVQGVGFRPFVYQLALTHQLKGSVLNSSQGVIIEAEGEKEKVLSFIKNIRANPPSLSRITAFEWEELPPLGASSFVILKSEELAEREALIPPDVAICPDCARETNDPFDRHYKYPFTNCTNCGPRFTITIEVPYDRTNTSMAGFVMCQACAAEYHNPRDRRFHAQPVACPVCGPQVELVTNQGEVVATKDWLKSCWDILQKGKILALKSLGGFHLACLAQDRLAVQVLRQRKGRQAKPFAVMCRDLKAVRKYCTVSEAEAALLQAKEAPIVILNKKPNGNLPAEIAPGLKTLGVMLPYTPLHLFLFAGPFDILIMTSGNYRELPLVKDNEQALKILGRLADYILWHNREIINRCDDSLVTVAEKETMFMRRSRGYVPQSIFIPRPKNAPVILGIGGEMKNCFCFLKGEQAFLSQHIGELDWLEGEENLSLSQKHWQRLLGITPEIVAFDLHPDYKSSEVARQIPAQKHIGVQHHHAHLAACLADNKVEDDEEVMGVILDGTGYGTDGCLWGFEFLTGSYHSFKRRYHLAYVPLPGGEKAIRQPWRTAVAYLITFMGEEGTELAQSLFPDKEVFLVARILESKLNLPLACGCGRLFDAVAATLGVCLENTYEGQAATELGELVLPIEEGAMLKPYPYEIKGEIIRPTWLIREILNDQKKGVAVPVIVTKFHQTLSYLICDIINKLAGETGLKKVALSGGSWQNRYLFQAIRRQLTSQGYQVLYHKQIPANDGGIALGQAMVADRRWQKECVLGFQE
jgi:hydrogenase maturation protein HypF